MPYAAKRPAAKPLPPSNSDGLPKRNGFALALGQVYHQHPKCFFIDHLLLQPQIPASPGIHGGKTSRIGRNGCTRRVALFPNPCTPHPLDRPESTRRSECMYSVSPALRHPFSGGMRQWDKLPRREQGRSRDRPVPRIQCSNRRQSGFESRCDAKTGSGVTVLRMRGSKNSTQCSVPFWWLEVFS